MLVRKDKITIICEPAQTYEGSFEIAEKLVESSVKAGADAVKFQVFSADELATPAYKYFRLFKKLELAPKQWKKLIDLAHEGKILFLADVFGIKSAKMLLKAGVDGFKIHATDLKNTPLLEFLASANKPLILSISGSYEEEIKRAVNILTSKKQKKREIVLMHGIQSFPTLVEDTNLNKLKLLQKTFGLPVGFADHIEGDHELKFDLCFMAAGLGISVIEKHITLSRILKMEDHESALNPDVFKEFVDRLRKAERALGKEKFVFSPAEDEYRRNTKKHIVAAKNLKRGVKITSRNFMMKRTDKNYPFHEINEFIGRRVIKPVKKDEIIKLENLK